MLFQEGELMGNGGVRKAVHFPFKSFQNSSQLRTLKDDGMRVCHITASFVLSFFSSPNGAEGISLDRLLYEHWTQSGFHFGVVICPCGCVLLSSRLPSGYSNPK